jgi:hypothetical protein
VKRIAVLLTLCGSSSIAAADEDRVAIKVEVGKTVETEVGFAMGHLCDDDQVVRAEMRNKNADTNVFAVTGVKLGTTLCRAGTTTIENRPTFLFEITVVPAAKRAPARR